jgi:replicative DNA helicase
MRDPDEIPEAETSVLGSVLLAPEVLGDVTPILRASDFYSESHRIVYTSMVLLHEAGKPSDVTLLVAHLRQSGQFEKVGGAGYLAKLSRAVPNAAHAVHYARIVVEASRVRRIKRAATEAIQEADGTDNDSGAILGALRAKLDQIEAEASSHGTTSLHEAARQRLELLENPQGSDLGRLIATGVECIDETYGGFRAAGLYVVAARPGRGKSALAKQIANSLDYRNHPVLFISLEMEPHEIAARVLSERTGIDGKRFDVGEDGRCILTEDELGRVQTAVEDCRSSVIHFQAPTGRNATIEGISALARYWKARHGLAVLVIDYLQLVAKSDRRQSDYEKATACSQASKAIARELGIAVLMLSQLNRDIERGQSKPRRPRLSDLRDSGAIEQDADAVIFLHQPDESSNDYELIVDKWRNDSRGIINVRLLGELTRFDPPAIEDDPNYPPEFAAWE